MTGNVEGIPYWVIIVGIVGVLGVMVGIIAVTEPRCPDGSSPTYSRGWYCTVPPLRK